MDLKARIFDYLADLLLKHASLYNSSELIAAFGLSLVAPTMLHLKLPPSAPTSVPPFFHVTNLVG
jgi:hypothetical protein